MLQVVAVQLCVKSAYFVSIVQMLSLVSLPVLSMSLHVICNATHLVPLHNFSEYASEHSDFSTVFWFGISVWVILTRVLMPLGRCRARAKQEEEALRRQARGLGSARRHADDDEDDLAAWVSKSR